MKHLTILLCLLISFSVANAQDNDEVHTLINKNTRVGAYLSLENQFKDFNTTFPGVYTGARLGLIFNRNLFVGLGAYGLTNEINLYDVFKTEMNMN
jgi:hypothetical protein